MPKKHAALFIFLLLLTAGYDVVSAAPPPLKIVVGTVTNLVSALVKWLWTMKSNTKQEFPGSKMAALPGRSMTKFESGYTVETVFDGSKHGIEPYSVALAPSGELFILDAENSNLYKISTPLSGYSRPKLVAGSPEGHSGHVDGKLRDARMNNPKGLTVDDKGNTYIADTLNMAVRKITEAGAVTTIAGGKRGHVDGPSDEAKFSNDFDVGYVASTCSLLVVDRGNQAIREIKLEEDDCSFRYDGSFNMGLLMLLAAGFFGYMMALLQRRVQGFFSHHPPPARSVRPPLIPNGEELEPKHEQDGFFFSLFRLLLNTASTACEIFVGLFTRKPRSYHYQESFVVPAGDEPPAKRSYPLVEKDPGFQQNWGYSGGAYGHPREQYQQQQQHRHRHYGSKPTTYYENNCETNEIVFRAMQEQDGRREAVVIKAFDYADPRYGHHNIRPRMNYVGYQNGY